jgi:hypothetical protein
MKLEILNAATLKGRAMSGLPAQGWREPSRIEVEENDGTE